MAKVKTKQFNRIKEVLSAQGKTQAWLAGQIGREFITINRYVNNQHQPSIELLFDIAKALRVNPKDLINS